MESVIALEELIKENEVKVELHQRQLQRHQSGEQPLSAMAEASAEAHLEEAIVLLDKYKKMLEKLSQFTPEELEEKERLHAAAMRKKYFDTQESRIKNDHEQPNDVKLEVLRIMGELPVDVQFEDEELFDMAIKSIDLELPVLDELVTKLEEIKNDFKSMINIEDERNLKEFATIDYLVPVIVLHFYILSRNIQENIHDYNEKVKQNQDDLMENTDDGEMFELEQTQTKVFKGFPLFQDWWIRELWVSHQAYFALNNWKTMITNMCMTLEQKKAWSIIFDRWVFIKKLLNDKGELAYNYNFAFDTLLRNHVDVREELDEQKMLAIESLIFELTKKEDFSTVAEFHDIKTPYYRYKLERVNPQNQEENPLD